MRFCNRSVVNPQPGQFVSEDFFLFLKPFARNSASMVAAVLDQTSAHVFMGLLETAVSKVKGCVRRSNSESVPLSVITKTYQSNATVCRKASVLGQELYKRYVRT